MSLPESERHTAGKVYRFPVPLGFVEQLFVERVSASRYVPEW
jgi:hypothetical protein